MSSDMSLTSIKHVPFDLEKYQLSSPWVQEKNASLWDKLFGYRLQIRVTVFPRTVIIQEVAATILTILVHDILAKLYKLWGRKPKFVVSVVMSGSMLVNNLTREQQEKVKQIIKKENLIIDDRVDDKFHIPFYTVVGHVSARVREFDSEQTIQSPDSSQEGDKVDDQKPTSNSHDNEKLLETSLDLIKFMTSDVLKDGGKLEVDHIHLIKQLAEEYFLNKEDDSTGKLITDYISRVVDNEKFLKNPSAFLADWKEKRGGSEQYIIPDDPARKFLEKIFTS